jgi:hypothetical protein
MLGFDQQPVSGEYIFPVAANAMKRLLKSMGRG